jgi:hypothetical protein
MERSCAVARGIDINSNIYIVICHRAVPYYYYQPSAFIDIELYR